MYTRQYRFKFYLNAQHIIKFDTFSSSLHPHTWEIVMYLKKVSDDFIQFTKLENEIQDYLKQYEGKLLNNIAPFDNLQPTMENIGEVLYGAIEGILKASSWTLNTLEISENPTRTYIIQGTEEQKGYSSNSYSSKEENSAFVPEIYFAPESRDEVARADEQVQDEIAAGQAEDVSELSQAATLEEPETADSVKQLMDRIHEDFADVIKIKKPVQKNRSTWNVLLFLLVSVMVVGAGAFGIYHYINRNGMYPWGSDTWGHLFRGHFLYLNASLKNLVPIYNTDWYNGIQPFRYFAPLPSAVLYAFEAITKGNVLLSYSGFVIFIFIAGAAGWLLFAVKTRRYVLGLVIAILWFFMPENIRVLFSEGNLSRVVVTALFPYLLFFIYCYIEKRTVYSLFFSFLCMFLITLSHAMIAAMVGITVFIFAMWYGAAGGKLKQSVEVIAAVIFGIAFAGIWLYPALKGGLLSFEADDVRKVMELLTYPFVNSINPLLRYQDIEIFYYGLPVFIISVLGILFAGRKNKVFFIFPLLVLLGSSRELIAVLSKIPLNQLFWMMRFTPLALGLFLLGLLLWKNLRKTVLIIFILLLIGDSAISFSLLAGNRQEPADLSKLLQEAASVATQRVAVLDASEFTAYPSYYLSYNGSKAVKQVFGWNWQGAKTSPNIVWLNTALEKGWYVFMFDRSLELGADTVVIKREKVKDESGLMDAAVKTGYQLIADEARGWVFKYPVTHFFGTRVDYTGFAIGKYASNITYIFPEFAVGNSEYIDDYTVQQLSQYQVIYMSGFKYRDKGKAEQMIKELSEKQAKCIIDAAGAQTDLYSSRSDFMDVLAQPVNFSGAYPVSTYRGESENFASFPVEYPSWNTQYLENLDNTLAYARFNNQNMSFIGTKYNDDIVYVGFNLVYFAMETRDSGAIGILEDLTGFTAFNPPEREAVDVDVTIEGNKMMIQSAQTNVLTDVADIDTLSLEEGQYGQQHNLVYLKSNEVIFDFKYPYAVPSMVISILGLAGFIGMCIYVRMTINNKGENKDRVEKSVTV